MPGTKAGFTLLELVVVIFVLGLLLRITVPMFVNRIPGYKRNEFITQVSSLIKLAWQNALITQRMHRVWFDLEKKIMRVEIVKPKKKGNDKEEFEPISVSYLKSEYHWPETFFIKQLYVDGTNILNQPGVKTETAWVYVLPEGLMQPTIINVVDTAESDEHNNEGKQIGLVVNPFTAQLSVYETFAKP